MAQRNAGPFGPTTIRAAFLRGLMRPEGYRGRRLLKQEHMGQRSHTLTAPGPATLKFAPHGNGLREKVTEFG